MKIPYRVLANVDRFFAKVMGRVVRPGGTCHWYVSLGLQEP